MVMDVEIVSKELIKPTSQTPNHLRNHRLSFLDQYVPSVSVPMVFFYTNQETDSNIVVSNSKRAQLLKQSLSETLTLFYPFAGRIKDCLSIDCNDEGAYYVEARVECRLNEFLKHPDPYFIPRLLPGETSSVGTTAGGYTAMIQVTTFACGGFVIGSFLSHLIADGPAATTFIRTWAAVTRKSCEEIAFPNFDASVFFPQSEAYPQEATALALFSPFLRSGICCTRRIVFDASAIDSLKARAASFSVPDPTRVETVSAFLGKCIMATLKAKSDEVQKPSVISHAVNLRKRAFPPFPTNSMGNFQSSASATVTDKEAELDELVRLIRKAIKKIDGDFVKSLQGEGGLLKFCEHINETGKTWSAAASENNLIAITSWCNFGLYEIDFGWGNPTWVTGRVANKSQSVFANTIVLMDTRTGDGIEAWVSLDAQGMTKLDKNEELLAFGSMEKSPLNV